jgi:hypothetical protein
MNINNLTEPLDIAHELKSRLADACGDLAMDLENPHAMPLDDKYKLWKQGARARGVTDFIGAYADHLYNDPDTNEMMADWMYDYTDDDAKQILICKELINIGHTSVVNFAEKRMYELHGRITKETAKA